MANQNASIDNNFQKSLLGVTDDASAELRRLLVDPVTGRLKCSAVIANMSVANGGTGVTSFTPYAVITGGTTSTGPVQQVSGLGSSGQVLTSNGAAALPTWQPASGGANTALSNLAAVAINTALIPGSAAGSDFGSATLPWKDIYLAGSSGTPGTNNFKFTGTSTSGTRTITLPNSNTTVPIFSQTVTFTGPTASRSFALPDASVTILTTNAVITLAQGGSGANLTASTGGIVYSDVSAMAILSGTATANKVLMSGSSAAPVWSTPTYPNASATTRKMIVSDGTNFVASTETWAVPGTSGNILTSDGTNWTSAASTTGMVLEGSDNTERTTTSATNVSLSTISVSIAVTKGILIKGQFRRSAAAQIAKINLKLNNTEIAAPSGGGFTVIGAGSAAIAVGTFEMYIPPQSTGYLYGGTFQSQAQEGLNGAGTNVTNTSLVSQNNVPNATITSVIIEGQIAGAATFAVKDIRVYSLA